MVDLQKQAWQSLTSSGEKKEQATMNWQTMDFELIKVADSAWDCGG